MKMSPVVESYHINDVKRILRQMLESHAHRNPLVTNQLLELILRNVSEDEGFSNWLVEWFREMVRAWPKPLHNSSKLFGLLLLVAVCSSPDRCQKYLKSEMFYAFNELCITDIFSHQDDNSYCSEIIGFYVALHNTVITNNGLWYTNSKSGFWKKILEIGLLKGNLLSVRQSIFKYIWRITSSNSMLSDVNNREKFVSDMRSILYTTETDARRTIFLKLLYLRKIVECSVHNEFGETICRNASMIQHMYSEVNFKRMKDENITVVYLNVEALLHFMEGHKISTPSIFHKYVAQVSAYCLGIFYEMGSDEQGIHIEPFKLLVSLLTPEDADSINTIQSSYTDVPDSEILREYFRKLESAYKGYSQKDIKSQLVMCLNSIPRFSSHLKEDCKIKVAKLIGILLSRNSIGGADEDLLMPTLGVAHALVTATKHYETDYLDALASLIDVVSRLLNFFRNFTTVAVVKMVTIVTCYFEKMLSLDSFPLPAESIPTADRILRSFVVESLSTGCCWEIKDSGLEFLISVANLAKSDMDCHISLGEAFTQVLPLLLNTRQDEEAYVRSSSYRALQCFTHLRPVCIHLSTIRPDFFKECLSHVVVEADALCRKSIISLLSTAYSNKIEDVRKYRNEIYKIMYLASMDLQSNVRMEALKFWELVISNQTIDVNYADNLSTIGCLQAISKCAQHECENAVQEYAVKLAKQILSIVEENDIQMKVDPANSAMEVDAPKESSTDATKECDISEVDKHLQTDDRSLMKNFSMALESGESLEAIYQDCTMQNMMNLEQFKRFMENRNVNEAKDNLTQHDSINDAGVVMQFDNSNTDKNNRDDFTSDCY